MAFVALPPDFSASDLQSWMHLGDVVDAVFRKHNSGQPSTEWREFVSAGNGMHYRWRALAEADEVLQKTIPLGQPSTEELYTEEAALFTFFSNALACIENACYMAYAFAGMIDALRFRQLQRDPSAVGPGFVRAEFKRILPKEPLTSALVALERRAIYHTIREARNILSHRGSIPRHFSVNIDFNTPGKMHYLGGPLGEPATWHGHTLDANFASRLRSDLIAVVDPVLRDGLTYAQRQIAAVLDRLALPMYDRLFANLTLALGLLVATYGSVLLGLDALGAPEFVRPSDNEQAWTENLQTLWVTAAINRLTRVLSLIIGGFAAAYYFTRDLPFATFVSVFSPVVWSMLKFVTGWLNTEVTFLWTRYAEAIKPLGCLSIVALLPGMAVVLVVWVLANSIEFVPTLLSFFLGERLVQPRVRELYSKLAERMEGERSRRFRESALRGMLYLAAGFALQLIGTGFLTYSELRQGLVETSRAKASSTTDAIKGSPVTTRSPKARP